MTSARTDSSSRSTLLPKAKQQNHQPYEDVTAPPPSSNMEKATNADYSRPSFELPLTGHPEAIHSLSPQIKRRTTFEQKSEHTEAMERRIKRHWYPYVAALMPAQCLIDAEHSYCPLPSMSFWWSALSTLSMKPM